MKKGFLVLLGVGVSMLSIQAYASEASQYCSDMYPPEDYESSERRIYINECLTSYAGHDDGFSEGDTGEEGEFDGNVNDFMNNIDSSD